MEESFTDGLRTLKPCLRACLLSARTCARRPQSFYKVRKSHNGAARNVSSALCETYFFYPPRQDLPRAFLCAVQFSSLKTETERIQAEKDQLQAELLASRTELDGLRVALSHLQNTNKALAGDKVNPDSLFRV